MEPVADLKEMEAQALSEIEAPAIKLTHYVVVTLYEMDTQKQVGRTGTCPCLPVRSSMKEAAKMACNMITLPKREESQP